MTDSPTLTLRGLQGDDWLALYPLLTRRDIQHDLFDVPYMSEETFRDRISNPPAHVHTLVANITLTSGRERVVGAVWVEAMAHRRRHVGRIQWVIHPDFHGTPVVDGVLQAALDLADNWLGLRRLEAVVFAADALRLPVLERHGFVREATMRHYAWRRGQRAAAVLLARLRPERDPAPEDSTDRERSRDASMTAKTAAVDVIVRGAEVDDWERIAAIRSRGNVVYHTLQLPYQSRDTVREYLENVPTHRRMLVAEVEGQVVGHLALHLHEGRRAHIASLGMMVHADHQGQGIGSALLQAAIDLAENWLNIQRIELEVYTDNEAGVALYRRFDFVVEGTLREYAYRDGQFVDAFLMARIRELEKGVTGMPDRGETS